MTEPPLWPALLLGAPLALPAVSLGASTLLGRWLRTRGRRVPAAGSRRAMADGRRTMDERCETARTPARGREAVEALRRALRDPLALEGLDAGAGYELRPNRGLSAIGETDSGEDAATGAGGPGKTG